MIRIAGYGLKDGKLIKAKPPKYRAKRCTLDGYKFDSQVERDRYAVLRQQEQAGIISDLKVHPLYDLRVNGILICNYEADFSYRANNAPSLKRLVIEDVKAVRTPDFKIKWKLMHALYPGSDLRLFDVLNGKAGRWTAEDIEALERRVQAAGMTP